MEHENDSVLLIYHRISKDKSDKDELSQLAQKKYKKRYDWVGLIYLQFCLFT